jgi:hypothetical protein
MTITNKHTAIVNKFEQRRKCTVHVPLGFNVLTTYNARQVYWVERPEDEYGIQRAVEHNRGKGGFCILYREDWIHGEKLFQKNDAVEFDCELGSGVGWIIHCDDDGTYVVTIHERYPKTTPSDCVRVTVTADQIKPFTGQIARNEPQLQTPDGFKADMKRFISKCSDEQLIEFIRTTADCGTMVIVRKAMLAWVGCSKAGEE